MTNAAKPPVPSRFSKAFFYVSLVFIVSGALNYGVTGYFLATPFALYAIRHAVRSFESRRPLFGVVIFIASGVLFNETMDRNPLVFPILVDGYLQEVRHPTGAQSRTSATRVGESLRVTGVNVGHAELGTRLELIGSDGRTYLGDSNDQLYYPYVGGKKSDVGFRLSGPLA